MPFSYTAAGYNDIASSSPTGGLSSAPSSGGAFTGTTGSFSDFGGSIGGPVGTASGTSGMSGASSAGASYGGSGFGTSSYGSGSSTGGSTGTPGGYGGAGNSYGGSSGVDAYGGGGESWGGSSGGGGWGDYGSSPIGFPGSRFDDVYSAPSAPAAPSASAASGGGWGDTLFGFFNETLPAASDYTNAALGNLAGSVGDFARSFMPGAPGDAIPPAPSFAANPADDDGFSPTMFGPAMGMGPQINPVAAAAMASRFSSPARTAGLMGEDAFEDAMDMATALALSSALSSRARGDGFDFNPMDPTGPIGPLSYNPQAVTAPPAAAPPTPPAASGWGDTLSGLLEAVRDGFTGLPNAPVGPGISAFPSVSQPEFVTSNPPMMAHSPEALQSIQEALMAEALANALPGPAMTPATAIATPAVPVAPAPDPVVAALPDNTVPAAWGLPPAPPAGLRGETTTYANIPAANTVPAAWGLPPSRPRDLSLNYVNMQLPPRPERDALAAFNGMGGVDLPAAASARAPAGGMTPEDAAILAQYREEMPQPWELNERIGRRQIASPDMIGSLFGLMGGPLAGLAARTLAAYDDPLSELPIWESDPNGGEDNSFMYGRAGAGSGSDYGAPPAAPAAAVASTPGALSAFRRRYLGAGDDLLNYGMAGGERKYFKDEDIA